MPTLAITLGMTVVTAGWIRAVGASLAVAIALGVLLFHRRAVVETTLRAAWWWSAAALVAWGAVELLSAPVAASVRGSYLAPLRFAALALSLCPAVAVIGAKRPQDRAWGLVVFSLWCVVSLPAAENFFLHRGQRLDIGEARAWLLWTLILLGPVNFVPTRHWLPAVLLAGGQVCALAPHLALLQARVSDGGVLGGLVLAAAAVAIAGLISRRSREAASGYDRLWLDFRDTFGLLWALRVQERMNAAAAQYQWNLELDWNGFRRRDDGGEAAVTIDPAMEPVLRTTFIGLLRRFVSGAWIHRRLTPKSG